MKDEKLKPRKNCMFCGTKLENGTKLEKIPSDSYNYNWYYCPKCGEAIRITIRSFRMKNGKGCGI